MKNLTVRGYSAIHNWVHRKFGMPAHCEKCGVRENGRMYHWANISGRYVRERRDWIRLCVSCHRFLDMSDEWKRNLSTSHARVDAKMVRELYATGKYTQSEIGKIVGCGQDNISYIVNNKTHRYA